MATGDPYWRLRDREPIPVEGVCACAGVVPVKLCPAVASTNPILCMACNLEVPPERLAFPEEVVDDLAYWKQLHDALVRLHLDSKEYESWAAARLADVQGRVNVLGRAVRLALEPFRRCYLQYFTDDTNERYFPPAVCPSCGRLSQDAEHGRLRQRVCEPCSLVW